MYKSLLFRLNTILKGDADQEVATHIGILDIAGYERYPVSFFRYSFFCQAVFLKPL